MLLPFHFALIATYLVASQPHPTRHQLRRCYARLFAASIVNQTSLIPESLITNEKSGAAPLRASNICDDDVIALFAMKEGLASSRSVLGTQPNK